MRRPRFLRAALLLLAAAAAPAPAAEDAPPAPAPPAPPADAAEAARIEEATKDLERRLGIPLAVARRGAFVVRGDLETADLEHLAEVASATLDHYAGLMATTPQDVMRARRKDEPPWIEILQFRREKTYLAYLDRVFPRVRDETVDDRRLALMRRQRGFFVLSPRRLIVQYQGPGELSTCASQVVHKTSHALLLSHRPAGTWMPWWFLEGFAAYEEFAVLKESRTYCLEIARPGDYSTPGTPEADEAAKARMESHWRRRARDLVASKAHRDLGALAKLPLNELVLDDVIQSWSVVEWIVRQRRLVAFTTAYKDARDFGRACEAALGAPPAGVESSWIASLSDAK